MQIFDFFLSIGPSCRPAYHLKSNHLRIGSPPLDWQISHDLNSILHLFETGFRDFFLRIQEDEQQALGENRCIIDTSNHITSLHHFPKSMPLRRARLIFLYKSQKQFFILNRRLKRAGKIALVSCFTYPAEDIREFLRRFSRLYPRAIIRLINIRNDNSLPRDALYEKEYILSDSLSLMEYTCNDAYAVFGWQGNQQIWSKILSQYALSDLFQRNEKKRRFGRC